VVSTDVPASAAGEAVTHPRPVTDRKESGPKRKPNTRLFAAALVLCLLAGARARADFINWDYSWNPSSSAVLADNPTMGRITLSSASGEAVGNSYIVATNIKTVSTADPSTPATFTNAAYGLGLTILDDASGKTGTLSYNGMFNGTLSDKSAIISNTFTGPQTQSVQLGNHLYTVQIGPFAPPGPPTATISGSISALANVSVKDVPEPSTLVLSGLCLSLCGAGWWWRRARDHSLALALA
jgi:hypothetical protein